jgi:hypothetical protein
MDKIFVNIIIPMLSYFQLLYDYFPLISIHPRLFLVILSNSDIWILVVLLLGLLVVISGYCYLFY